MIARQPWLGISSADDRVKSETPQFHVDDGSLLDDNDNPSARQNQALHNLIEANTDMSIFRRHGKRLEDE